MIRRVVDRPSTVFDAGLQHERTALAWERTAISTMVRPMLGNTWNPSGSGMAT